MIFYIRIKLKVSESITPVYRTLNLNGSTRKPKFHSLRVIKLIPVKRRLCQTDSPNDVRWRVISFFFPLFDKRSRILVARIIECIWPTIIERFFSVVVRNGVINKRHVTSRVSYTQEDRYLPSWFPTGLSLWNVESFVKILNNTLQWNIIYMR